MYQITINVLTVVCHTFKGIVFQTKVFKLIFIYIKISKIYLSS